MTHPRRPYQPRHTYSTLDLMLASPQPMSSLQRMAYIAGFKRALHAIQFEPISTPEQWRIMADAVNLVETFCAHPWPDPQAPRELIDIAEEAGALQAAAQSMREAARLHKLQGGSIRISADGREALAGLVELLDTILQTISHRAALQCHNECERAIRKQRAERSAEITTL